MPSVRTKTTGGVRLKATIANIKASKGVSGVQVGFFRTARYPDGTPVTNVAAWNEFGTTSPTGAIPPRPFMRGGVQNSIDDVRFTLRARLQHTNGVVTPQLAEQIGALVAGHIQREIVELRTPPNAPSTIERKGSSNPLINTGFMRRSVSWKLSV